MTKRIAMDEIPFAPVMERTDDTIPPVELPPVTKTKRVEIHRLIGWRHDGGLLDQKHEDLQRARDAARELHWVIYWKYAIQCGRDMVERSLIEEPSQ